MKAKIFSGVIPALMTPCKDDRTPDFDALVPTECHLAWDVTLVTKHGRDAIEDVFIFVIDDMTLDIQAVEPEAAEAEAAEPEAAEEAQAEELEEAPEN